MAIAKVEAPGATPLDPDEAAGLLPTGVTTVEALNAYESENILAALGWLESVKRKDPLDDEFLRELHRRMFDRTWRWSGRYRQSEKNIGIDPARIAVAVRELTLDVRMQVDAAGADLDAIAARFHHRLVWIHPFANGNGRHARLAADLLLEQGGRERFSWGAGDLMVDGPARQSYIESLRKADGGDLAPLIRFVRS